MMMNDTQSIGGLLNAHIAWIKEAGFPRWRAKYRGEKCELRMNNFPEEQLYTLKWRGESIDFDDLPPSWSVPRD
jgi:hypothetical protein